MKVPPPKEAILDLESLQNIMVLGLPIYMWHVDDGLINEKTPIRLLQTPYGISIHFDISSRYLTDVGIPDSTIVKTERIWKYQDYMFNTYEEAVQAMYENDKACEELFILKQKERA